jgi:hypothetical protein
MHAAEHAQRERAVAGVLQVTVQDGGDRTAGLEIVDGAGEQIGVELTAKRRAGQRLELEVIRGALGRGPGGVGLLLRGLRGQRSSLVRTIGLKLRCLDGRC